MCLIWMQAIALALACLSYDFVGTSNDDSSEDLGTIQVGILHAHAVFACPQCSLQAHAIHVCALNQAKSVQGHKLVSLSE